MSYKVLIVDDSATMRKIIMRSLRQAGIDVGTTVEAGDGAEGLAALKGGGFDLVLSDVNMPNMNGLDFCKAAKAEVKPLPPIVMITTEGSEDIIAQAMNEGAQGYVKKPFTPEKLGESLNAVLKK
ncbi:MAG: response regulator [Planctomycetota bacterium]